MLVTLNELQSRMLTVRRNLGDSFGLVELRVRINGQWIEATRKAFVVDDTGAIIIETQLNERVPESHVEKCADSFPDFVVRAGEHIESKTFHEGRKCVCGQKAFLVQINTGKTFQYCFEFVVACSCGRMTVRSTCVVDVIKIWNYGREIENQISALKPTALPPWKAAFERFRTNEYTDYESVTMFNFSLQRMQDAVEVAAAAEEAIEWGSRWEALSIAQSELIQTLCKNKFRC